MYTINDPVIKSWMIGLGNIYSCRYFKNSNIILDRHLVSNYFWNGFPESDIVFKSIIELIGFPDLTILLHASLNTRKERLALRDKNDRDNFDSEILVDGYDKMRGFLANFHIPYIEIDTENKNIDEVYLNILNVCKEYMERMK